MLLSYVQMPNIQPNCLRSLLSELLVREVDGARGFAEELLCFPYITTETPEFEIVVLAIRN